MGIKKYPSLEIVLHSMVWDFYWELKHFQCCSQYWVFKNFSCVSLCLSLSFYVCLNSKDTSNKVIIYIIYSLLLCVYNSLKYVTLHSKRYHLALKIIFEFIVPCYKHGNTGLIGEGFTHLQASVA